ncbi:MAG: hypothetical protein EPN94_02825 [Nitrospirae bacterium]|nr:MAG: hypothetical protein EPN94_02825 [Nitrospirota bacterium]
MNIIIKAIKFNHDSNSADHDALNIRKNKSQFINVPEWVQGISTSAEDSLAAYAIKETQGKTITIQARFQADGIEQAEIRAIDPTITPSGCIGWIIKIFIAIFGNVLGEVKEKLVTFGPGGDSGFVTFELKDPNLWDVGVGIHYTTWKWQYRLNNSSPWVDIDTTRHKIYVLLEIPKDPWKQTPYSVANDQLPWVEVMDYSCIWAIGSKDRDTAAGKVTERINALGPSVVEYDCPGGGYSNYSAGSFKCTNFLERLKGGPGLGKYVNCSDCATIVSTFSNIIGCDLWQSRMGTGFGLNEVISIGYSTWSTPCSWASFNYHEVAWKGACDINDEVFDACLKVDGDSSPRFSPHTPLLPVNMKFGNCGDLLYRDRLTSLSGCSYCNPQPGTKQHRQVI